MRRLALDEFLAETPPTEEELAWNGITFRLRLLDAVALDVLRGEEPDEGLRGGQAHRLHCAVSTSSSCSSSASSRPPAMSRTSSWRSISLFSYAPKLWPRLRMTNRSPTGCA